VKILTADQLARDAKDFLNFKRAMGIRYRRAEFVLDDFVRFVGRLWGGEAEVRFRQCSCQSL
jgi:hypothetical protein